MSALSAIVNFFPFAGDFPLRLTNRPVFAQIFIWDSGMQRFFLRKFWIEVWVFDSSKESSAFLCMWCLNSIRVSRLNFSVEISSILDLFFFFNIFY